VFQNIKEENVTRHIFKYPISTELDGMKV